MTMFCFGEFINNFLRFSENGVFVVFEETLMTYVL